MKHYARYEIIKALKHGFHVSVRVKDYVTELMWGDLAGEIPDPAISSQRVLVNYQSHTVLVTEGLKLVLDDPSGKSSIYERKTLPLLEYVYTEPNGDLRSFCHCNLDPELSDTEINERINNLYEVIWICQPMTGKDCSSDFALSEPE